MVRVKLHEAHRRSEDVIYGHEDDDHRRHHLLKVARKALEMRIEYDTGQRDDGEDKVNLPEVASVADSSPLIGNEVDVIHNTPREYHD